MKRRCARRRLIRMGKLNVPPTKALALASHDDFMEAIDGKE